MAENVREIVTEALAEFFQDQLQPRFEQIDRRFEQIDQRSSVFEFRLSEHDRMLSAILDKQAEHDGRFRDILGHFDQLYQRPTRPEDAYHFIRIALRRIEEMLAGERLPREILEKRLDELKLQADGLQTRITEPARTIPPRRTAIPNAHI